MTKSTKPLLDYVQVGNNLALSFIQADTTYLNTKRDLLLSTVEHHGDIDKLNRILEGYKQAWLNNGYNENVAKVRASEANTVFKAVLMTQVSNENLNKLKQYVGSYNEFIKFARSLLPKKAEKPNDGNKTVRKLSDSAFGKLDETIDRLSSEQVASTVSKASAHLFSLNQDASVTGLQQFILINNIANQMLKHSDKFDAFTLKYADEFSKMSNLAIEHIQGSLAKASEAISNAMDSTPYDNVETIAPKQESKGKAKAKPKAKQVA